MVLPSKLYETLKFLVKFVPLLVTFVGTVFLACGISEQTVNIILVILGAVGALVEGLIEICKANHYKIVAEDGTIYYIDDTGDAEEKTQTAPEATAAEDKSQTPIAL